MQNEQSLSLEGWWGFYLSVSKRPEAGHLWLQIAAICWYSHIVECLNLFIQHWFPDWKFSKPIPGGGCSASKRDWKEKEMIRERERHREGERGGISWKEWASSWAVIWFHVAHSAPLCRGKVIMAAIYHPLSHYWRAVRCVQGGWSHVHHTWLLCITISVVHLCHNAG